LITGTLFLCIIVLAALGVPHMRKFLRGLVLGPPDVYVVFDFEGRTLVFKNPNQPFEPIDRPLEIVPTEIFTSDQFQQYHNICWFDDCGTIHRCAHEYHRTTEAARDCRLSTVQHTFVAKVLEGR